MCFIPTQIKPSKITKVNQILFVLKTSTNLIYTTYLNAQEVIPKYKTAETCFHHSTNISKVINLNRKSPDLS